MLYYMKFRSQKDLLPRLGCTVTSTVPIIARHGERSLSRDVYFLSDELATYLQNVISDQFFKKGTNSDFMSLAFPQLERTWAPKDYDIVRAIWNIRAVSEDTIGSYAELILSQIVKNKAVLKEQIYYSPTITDEYKVIFYSYKQIQERVTLLLKMEDAIIQRPELFIPKFTTVKLVQPPGFYIPDGILQDFFYRLNPALSNVQVSKF